MPTSEARCSLKSAVWRRIEWVHQSANDKTTTWPPAAGSAWKSCFDQLGHERSAVIIQRCAACPWISAIFPGGRHYFSPHKMAKKNHWLSWHSRFNTWVIENVNWSQKHLGILPSSLWNVFLKFFLQMNPIPMRKKTATKHQFIALLAREEKNNDVFSAIFSFECPFSTPL